MKKRLLSLVLNVLGEMIKELPPDKAKEAVDDMLDAVEKRVAESETRVDDVLVVPALRFVRAVAGIPDDIGGDAD